jgi:hypothetical protein
MASKHANVGPVLVTFLGVGWGGSGARLESSGEGGDSQEPRRGKANLGDSWWVRFGLQATPGQRSPLLSHAG